jgi:hypothetical protein
MSAYPLYLGKVSRKVVNASHQKTLLGGRAASSCPRLGNIDVDELSEGDPLLPELASLCRRHMILLNDDHPGAYATRDYTFGAGSVPLHVDHGMGLTVGVLVATSRLSEGLEGSMPTDFCYLVTKRGDLELAVGDSFAFDASRTHGWMANCRWALALHSARRTRSKRVLADNQQSVDPLSMRLKCGSTPFI